jgi:hypothetical protein
MYGWQFSPRRLEPTEIGVWLVWRTSNDVQDRLAGELAIDKPAGDSADLAPWGFDRDLRLQLFGCDQIGEQREANSGPLDAHQFVEQDNGPLYRPIRNNRTGKLDKALDPDMVYRLVRGYSAELGFEIGAHALRATAATNALDHQADIAKVQEWLGHANIATTRIYDHRKTGPEDSPTFKVNY